MENTDTNKNYTLWYARHGGEYTEERLTLIAAIKLVQMMMAGDDAWPIKITTQTGETVWEQFGPMQTLDSFREFAARHDVQLDEDL